MKVMRSIVVVMFVTVPLFGMTPAAVAQSDSSPLTRAAAPSLPPQPVRQRIEIHPGRLLYRQCVDWYELQDRPSGRVLYPGMRCWWVRG